MTPQSPDRASCPAHGGNYPWTQDCPECAKDARQRGMSVERYYREIRPYLTGPLPQAGEQPHQQLMKFYGVDSLEALVDAQARHIEKLQAKLPPTPSLAPQRVREG